MENDARIIGGSLSPQDRSESRTHPHPIVHSVQARKAPNCLQILNLGTIKKYNEHRPLTFPD